MKAAIVSSVITGVFSIIVAIFGTIQWDINGKEVYQAKKYRDNLACLQNNAIKMNTVKLDKNSWVSVKLCPNTGDTLIIAEGYNNQTNRVETKQSWVGYKKFLFSELVVQKTQPMNTTFLAQVVSTSLCPVKIRNGILFQRVQEINGVCFDQQIRVTTGTVLSSVQVPCNNPCP